MVATVAAGTAAQYYLAQTQYYLGGSESEGRWLAVGSRLGITESSVVERATFEQLHAALNTSGRSLIGNDGGRIEKVGGYDVTFSAPKSLSVLWAVTDVAVRAELEAAQATAVAAALAFIDREAAFCRRGRGGAILEKVRLTAASFQHGEARPAPHADGAIFADPALHTHVVILNLAERADGTFGRLDGRPLFHWKMAAGAVYHQALAASLRKLGYGIDVTGSNGTFEIAGTDPLLCRYFSARRHEIEEELAAVGLATADAPALAAAKARATRRSKTLDGGEDRHTLWREHSMALGITPERFVGQMRAVGRERALREAAARSVELRSARVVLAELTERNSLFEHRQFAAALAAARVGSDMVVSVEAELAELRTQGIVVDLGRDRWGHAIYSTPEVVQLEKSLFVRAARLATAEVTAPAFHHVDRLVAAAGLNAEQNAAARLACGPKAIVTIEGAPGVGKTTLLRPVAAAWEASGWRVIGASTAWKVAHQLEDELGIEARSIDSWLASAEHGRSFLSDRTVILVDESGLLTSQQMQRILAEVEQARDAGLAVAVRMVGDRRQLQPIGGPGLRIVAEAIGTQRVDTIVRQHEPWARDVVTAFGDGRAADALDSLVQHGCVHEADGPAATITALVDYWDRWRREHANAESLLVAKTNAQVAALNRAVRQRLRAAGELAADDATSLAAVTPSGQPYILDLAEGDRVRFLLRHDALGIVNGTEGRIERIEPAPDGELRLQATVGDRLVVFAPADLADEAGRARLAHAYATTCYGVQGLTTEAAFVLADTAMDRHDIHVAASRARRTTQLFVDRRGLDARVRSKRLLGEREQKVETEERTAALAAALACSSVKHTTLDTLTSSQRQALLDDSNKVGRHKEWLSRAQPPDPFDDQQARLEFGGNTSLYARAIAQPKGPAPKRRLSRSNGLSLG